MTLFHRGAVVSHSPWSRVTYWPRAPGLSNDRFNRQYRSNWSISVDRFAQHSNRNRQRHKGPVVRFGRES